MPYLSFFEDAVGEVCPLFFNWVPPPPQGGNPSNNQRIGHRAALSKNGNVIVAGLPSYNTSASVPLSGRANTFLRASGSPDFVIDGYLESTQVITNGQMGYASAVSGDGLICAVGQDVYLLGGDSTKRYGAVYIFTRPDTATPWTQTQLLQPADYGAATARFGVSIDISADGAFLYVGANRYSGNNGGVFIYQRISGSYVLQQIVTGTGAENFGWSVRASADGTRFVAGLIGFGGSLGAVRVYVKSGPTFVLEQTIQPPSPVAEQAGYSVAINGNGTVLCFGCPFFNGAGFRLGRFFIYTRSGTTWSLAVQHQDPTNANLASMGTACAINEAGTRIAVGVGYLGSVVGGNGYVDLFNFDGSSITLNTRYPRPDPLAGHFGSTSICFAENATCPILMITSASETVSAETLSKIYLYPFPD